MKITDKRTKQRKVGDKGEDLACGYIKGFGYSVLARNFSCKTGELDIIALKEDEGLIAFIEVKSRKSVEFGLPCEAVDTRKQQKLKRTAEYFLMTHKEYSEYQPSMDIVEILRLDGEIYARHLKDAF